MSKFEKGDKAYYFATDGIVTIEDVDHTPYCRYPVQISLNSTSFTSSGLYSDDFHKVPLLYTLDEALEKGFITRETYEEHRPKKKRILKQALIVYEENYPYFASDHFYETLEEARKKFGRGYRVIKLLDHTAVEVEE